MSDQLTEFCRDRYDYEATRRGDLTGAVALPVGVLSVLAGALLAILKELRAPIDISESLLVFSAASSLLACVVSAGYLARSYFGYTYRYVATPKQVRDYHTSIKNAFLAAGGAIEHASPFANTKVLEYLQERYAESAHHNTLINDRKSSLLHRANAGMIVALIPAVVAGSIYFYTSLSAQPVTTKVELVNVESIPPKGNCDANGYPEGSAASTPTPTSEGDVAGTTTGPIRQRASGPHQDASK